MGVLQPKYRARFTSDKDRKDPWSKNEPQTPMSRLGSESNVMEVFSSVCASLDWMMVEMDLIYCSLRLTVSSFGGAWRK